MRDVQVILGHAHLSTTADVYLNPRELHQTGAFALVAW
jgi:integrase